MEQMPKARAFVLLDKVINRRNIGFFKRLKLFLLEANKKVIATLWQRPG